MRCNGIEMRHGARRILPKLAGLSALAVLLGGCAVMQIDVHVYKGPLSNHRDVQSQRIASLAIAAKPLLIDLRNDLERKVRDDLGLPFSKIVFKNDFVSIVDLKGDNFRNEQAERVNNVLSLYENKGLPFVSDLVDGRNELASALAKFSPDKKARQERWDTIAWEIRNDDDMQGLTKLRNAFEAVLNRKEDAKFIKIADIRGAIEGPNVIQGAVDLPIYAPSSGKGLLAVWNYHYGVFAGESYFRHDGKPFTDKFSKLLFDDPDSASARLFRLSLTQTANGYFEVRRAIEKIWRTGVGAMVELNSKAKEAQRNTPVLQQKNDAQMREGLADLIANFTQPAALAIAVCADTEDVGDTKKPPLARITQILSAETLKADRNWNKKSGKNESKADKARREIRQKLKSNNELVGLLRLADFRFRVLPEKAIEACTTAQKNNAKILLDRAFYAPPVGRQFGIMTTGTTSETEISKISDVIPSIVTDIVSAGGAGGFERGRLPDGVEAINEEFLKLSATPGVDKKLFEEKRKLLIDVLVRFSEKMLFVANNEAIISDPSTKATFSRFTLALQAIGNTIQVQADEILHRQSYDENLAKRGKSELRAWAEAFGRTSTRVIDDLVSGLQDDVNVQDKLSKSLKEADEAAAKLAQYAVDAVAANTANRSPPSPDAAGTVDALGKIKQRIDVLSRIVDTNKVLKGSSPASAADKAAILAQLDIDYPSGATGSGNEMVAKIDKWLAGEIAKLPASLKSNPRRILLNNAHLYLSGEGKDTFGGIVAAVPSVVLPMITTRSDAQAANVGLTMGGVESLPNLKLLADAIKSKSGTKLSDASTKLTKLNSVVSAVSGLKAGVLKKADAKDLQGDPKAIFRMLVDDLKKLEVDAKTARNVADEAKFKAAGAAVTKRVPQIALGVIPRKLADESANAKEVLDNLIAVLRYEETLAIARDGKSAKSAINLRAAIDNALLQRADMAYLRPTSSYLKSSYAATGLQGNEGEIWRNRLSRHSLRSIPLIAEGLVNSNKKGLIIQREIDKQFWQNINSVRVAGGGDTNYAIAKDDIGNWYVKAYSADPSDIIASARNLALFGAGGGLGTDLLNQTLSREGGTAIPGAADKTTLERMFDKFLGRYEDDTKALQAILVDRLKDAGLKNDIEDAWRANVNIAGQTDLFEKLNSNSAILSDAGTRLAETKDQDDNDLSPIVIGKNIIAAAKSIRRFNTKMISAIVVDQATLASSKTEKGKDEALKIVNQKVVDQLKSTFDSRWTTNKDFGTAIIFIGDAVKE